jgi:polysaccharide deacetylase family protein (PEP-CTERM system associated)
MTSTNISLTIDIEQNGSPGGSTRFIDALQPLLGLLEDSSVSATFFIVGELAPHCEDLLTKLHSLGHEIALHGNTHRFLKNLSPVEFREELQVGRRTIETITGTPIVGFRAPYFSLTKETYWASQILSEEGFMYSSSVLPAFNPQAGLATAPRKPFKWKSGLVEFPVATFGFGPFRLPILGGAYLRLSPLWLVVLAQLFSQRSPGVWTYCHPYDFDVDEDFFRHENSGLLISHLLFARRHLMLKRIERIVTPQSTSLENQCKQEKFLSALEVWRY